MANNKKTLQSGKFWTGVISLIVVIAILLSVIMWRTDGGQDWTFGFGDKQSQQPEQTQSEKTSGEIEVIIPESTLCKTALMSLEAQPLAEVSAVAAEENVYTITATVRDEYNNALSDIQSVKVSMDWSQPKTEPVTDYVQMTTEGTTATFKLIEPYDTQITVTFVSEINEEVTATAVLNYVNRVKSLIVNWEGTEYEVENGGTIDVTFMPKWSYSSDNNKFPVAFMTEGLRFVNTRVGIGSIQEVNSLVRRFMTGRISVNSSFYKCIQETAQKYSDLPISPVGDFRFTYIEDGIFGTTTIRPGVSYTAPYSEFDIIYGIFYKMDEQLNSGNKPFFRDWSSVFFEMLNATENQFNVELNIGGGKNTYFTFNINASVRQTNVTDIELDNSAIEM